jgi:hypothetical protein
MQKRFHPDEIKATKISLGRLGRQMNTDEHGLKRKLVSPSERKDTLQVGTFVYLVGIPPPGGLY